MTKNRKQIPEALKKRISQIHVLTHTELRKLFSVITDLRDRAMFLVAYRHGLRASEVALLTTGDLDMKKLKITVRRISRGSSADHDLQKMNIKPFNATCSPAKRIRSSCS